ncbi:hypothetical protein TPL01_14650 [Sulfuriferula plumbiphila]|uniref:DUF2934 domain-containing protein n=1 Tax=Sulfuriferula plumbiphila TaxID=171865 RepID=A0A512L799_9PROT|nr:DUF2934 domain-containing protein [Sulfuriferula plumbiphila]BBP05289.1 hypothetical protein SFPGR_27110 [Sulfuriferula plumbiphila]GEP30327.1 hypothetical protein TPL01_14650 [Sulfuriferula plumbiphila]
MAESKAKSKASGKPVSAVAETKPKAKTAQPAAGKAAAQSAVAAKPKVAKPKVAAPGANEPAAKRSVKLSNPAVSAEQRYRMIAEAAYYIAERRNFAPGDAAADWAQAEVQIVALLNKK